MKYAAAIAKFFAVNVALGNEHVPLWPIAEANALAAIGADAGLDVSPSGQLLLNGKVMQGPVIDLPFIVEAPGFLIDSMVTDGTVPFLVDPSSPPSVLLSPWTVDKAAGVVGDSNVSYLTHCAGLIGTQLKGTSLIPGDECDRAEAICLAGVVCIPCNETMLLNKYRTLGDMHLHPDFPPEVVNTALPLWSQVVAIFDGIRKAQASSQYTQAQQLAESAAANVDFWNNVYHVVETIAAPAILAGLAPASDNFKPLVDWTSAKTWWTIGVVAALGIGVIAAVQLGGAAKTVKALVKG